MAPIIVPLPRQFEGVAMSRLLRDVITCSNGSPMAIDRVPEKWTGHYVNINGTAMKGPGGWYIIARSIKDVAD
jgi:hypothetical protein